MANGDIAASIGIPTVAPTDDKRLGYDEINRALDVIAQHLISGTHPASAITSGTLPVARGGTGATSTTAARTALGAAATSHTHSAADITSGNITRPVLTTGTGRFGAAWNNDVGAVTRRAVWMDSAGTLGHTSSSRRYKKAIRRALTDPEAILSLEAKYYAPRARRWQNEQDHEPTYIGFIAEDLEAAGLWEFIFYDDKGRPDGIHYELLGIAAIIAAQHVAARVSDLEERLAKLEGDS